MNKPLLGQKIAVLVANGFAEDDLISMQKAMMDAGGDIRIVSMDNGLVHSWNQDGWGLNYAPDQVLNRALAADYDMLVVPGGRRSIEKLELTAHTRRFIGGFVNCGKKVVCFEDAVELLLMVEGTQDIVVAGPERLQDVATEHGYEWFDGPYMISGDVMTGLSNGEAHEGFAKRAAHFLITDMGEEESEKTSRQLEAA